jgi:Protein of unknown function (DUF4199)
MRKLSIEIKWALVFVATTLVWMLGEKLAGFHDARIEQHPTATMFFAVPAIAVYVLALLDKRRNFYGGTMTYVQGLVCGLFITLFVTLLSPLTQVIVSKVITPGYFPNAIDYAVRSGLMEPAAAEKEFSLGNYIKQGLIGAPVMGIVTSAIVAIFTRKAKKEVREGKVDVVFVDGPKTPRN